MESYIVAVEGLVHAGKSTVVREISGKMDNVRCIGEYIDFTKEKFPGFPQSSEDASRARNFFLKIEKERKKSIIENDTLVVIDRSVLSILAYHFAVESITKRKISCFSESSNLILQEAWIFPQMCIYLDVDDLEIAKRHQTETGGYSSILLNPQFNACQRMFYEQFVLRVFPSLKMLRIDANNSIEQVLFEVETILASVAE